MHQIPFIEEKATRMMQEMPLIAEKILIKNGHMLINKNGRMGTKALTQG